MRVVHVFLDGGSMSLRPSQASLVALGVSLVVLGIHPRLAVGAESEEGTETSASLQAGMGSEDQEAEVAQESADTSSQDGEDAESAQAEDSESAQGAAESPRPSPLDLMAGMKLSGRAFRYTGSLERLYPGQGFPEMPEYSLDASPVAAVRGHWYPGAHFTGGALANIGVSGMFESGFATTVAYGTETFKQTQQLWYAGLRGRIPVDKLTFGIEAGYGNQIFKLDDSADGSPAGIFPNVKYSNVEIGGDVELKWDSYYLGGQAAYILVLSEGELGSDAWFPNAKGYGVMLGGHVGWEAHPMLDLLAGLEMRAYGFNFNPVSLAAPDDRVAGGATDRYMSVYFALRFKLPGQGAAQNESIETESDDDFDDFDF